MRITFVDSAGTARSIEAKPGLSVMEVAKANFIPEIDADCGGVCSCASCHVYVDPGWIERFPPLSRNENTLLALVEERRPNSRLSCQLKLTDGMDGLTVTTPAPA
ncbi:MAG TPA: 2Fe-2S iron-sulfur cluster-binding protein [Rhizomicrobium sp.]|nr:2Fe-2S iron-sulfur cluster-binding protein [Rhizomicrobium sp.]